MNQNCCGNSDRVFNEIFKTLTENVPAVFIVLTVIAVICFILFIGYFVTVQNAKRQESRRKFMEDKKLE